MHSTMHEIGIVFLGPNDHCLAVHRHHEHTKLANFESHAYTYYDRQSCVLLRSKRAIYFAI